MELLWSIVRFEMVGPMLDLEGAVVDVDLLIETCLDRKRSAANLLLVSFSVNDTTDVARKEIRETGALEEI